MSSTPYFTEYEQQRVQKLLSERPLNVNTSTSTTPSTTIQFNSNSNSCSNIDYSIMPEYRLKKIYEDDGKIKDVILERYLNGFWFPVEW